MAWPHVRRPASSLPQAGIRTVRLARVGAATSAGGRSDRPARVATEKCGRSGAASHRRHHRGHLGARRPRSTAGRRARPRGAVGIGGPGRRGVGKRHGQAPQPEVARSRRERTQARPARSSGGPRSARRRHQSWLCSGWRRHQGGEPEHRDGPNGVAVLPVRLRQTPPRCHRLDRGRRLAAQPSHRGCQGAFPTPAPALAASAAQAPSMARCPRCRRGDRAVYRRSAGAIRRYRAYADGGPGRFAHMAGQTVAQCSAAGQIDGERRAAAEPTRLLLRPLPQGDGSIGDAVLDHARKRRRTGCRSVRATVRPSGADIGWPAAVPAAGRRRGDGLSDTRQRLAAWRQHLRAGHRSVASGTQSVARHRRAANAALGHDVGAAATAASRTQGGNRAIGAASGSLRRCRERARRGQGPRRHARLCALLRVGSRVGSARRQRRPAPATGAAGDGPTRQPRPQVLERATGGVSVVLPPCARPRQRAARPGGERHRMVAGREVRGRESALANVLRPARRLLRKQRARQNRTSRDHSGCADQSVPRRTAGRSGTPPPAARSARTGARLQGGPHRQCQGDRQAPSETRRCARRSGVRQRRRRAHRRQARLQGVRLLEVLGARLHPRLPGNAGGRMARHQQPLSAAGLQPGRTRRRVDVSL